MKVTPRYPVEGHLKVVYDVTVVGDNKTGYSIVVTTEPFLVFLLQLSLSDFSEA